MVGRRRRALRYQDGKFTRFGPAQGLLAQRLEMLREDAEGRIIAVTQDGLWRLEGERFVPFEQNGALSSKRVGTALTDRAGNLWIGSVAGWIATPAARWFPTLIATAASRGGVNALFEDREGCLWMGTTAGLCRLTDPPRLYAGDERWRSGAQALAVRQTRDGAVWISSWADGVYRLQDGATTHYAPGAPLSPDHRHRNL